MPFITSILPIKSFFFYEYHISDNEYCRCPKHDISTLFIDMKNEASRISVRSNVDIIIISYRAKQEIRMFDVSICVFSSGHLGKLPLESK